MKIYAVIPTHNRHEDLAALLRTIPADVHVLVIDNASEPPSSEHDLFQLRMTELARTHVVRDEEQPPNLSRLWNIGLDWAHTMSNHDPDWRRPALDPRPEYAVAILNDDVVLSPNLLGFLAKEMAHHDVDIAFPGHGTSCDVNTTDPFPGVARRMTGWCFLVRGSSGIRADESLRWWCGDDDIQADAVRNGRGSVGVFLEPEYKPTHKHPDESTVGVLREQTDKDMTTFVEKWGQRPW